MTFGRGSAASHIHAENRMTQPHRAMTRQFMKTG
jgi:hypothetical protein